LTRERGLDVDHSTVLRWVQRHAPEINKCVRQHLKMNGTSYRVDETYVKVGKTCKYLYRAVDKEGNTIELRPTLRQEESASVAVLQSFRTAGRTLEGIESINMIRKGQVKRLAGSDARGQATFGAALFGSAA
jgi:transposase-like protein